jgi:flagellar assembly protein FliH
VALAVLKKVLPAACELHAFDEVTRVVEEVVGHLLDEPRIIVKTAEPLVEAVRERLEAVCASHGFEGRVVVQADARLSPGDCRVEWADGGAERDQARLMADIEATIERSLAPPERRVEEHEEFAGT